MQYLATLLALAGAVAAQTAGYDAITSPGEGVTMVQGDVFDIKWQFNENFPGTSTIVLIGGASSTTLDVVETITADVDNAAGHFQWKVDTSGKTVYGFQIIYNKDKTVFQYSFPFSISPGTSTPPSTWSSSITTSAPTTKSDSKTWKPTPTGYTTPSGTGGGHWGSPTGSSEACDEPATSKPWGGNYTRPTGGDCECEEEKPTKSWATLVTPTTAASKGPIGGPSTSVITGAAATAVAGGAAMLGGLAMAMLAL